jgi:hypothetical protein
VSPSLFVAVKGGQVKLAASSGSDIRVIVLVVTARKVEVHVVKLVLVAAGQAEQNPSPPQKAIGLQHSLSQQLSESGHDPPSQQISESGS